MEKEGAFVFVDIETAGIDPKRHPILQIAAIAADQQLRPLEGFEAKAQFDDAKANKNSLRKNHYSRGVWATEAIPAKEVAKQFADFLRRHASIPVVSSSGATYRVAQLVAHNAAFDGPFLTAWFERQGIFLPAKRHPLCTMQRAMWYFAERPELRPPSDYKLATLCRLFNVSFHAASAHEALGDATATLGLYAVMARM